jgi:ubiquinone/menaquinone biosynthesis C-methylase UbiE
VLWIDPRYGAWFGSLGSLGSLVAMRTSSRVDYDAIAHLYDGQPYRGKTADRELAAFVEQRGSLDRLSILDIGCGTGSQLAANRPVVPEARLVGLDRSLGMLRQAQPKATNIAWVQADCAMLPFQAESFDFITCQFAFHHVSDKASTLGAVFQSLRPGGRLVIRNLCPQEHRDWLYYEYFPQALAIDLADFWPPETIEATMAAIGFRAVTVEREHLRLEQDLRAWHRTVLRRDTNSQLLAISDAAYETGIRRLEHELEDANGPVIRVDHLCFVTIRGDKRSGPKSKADR